MNIEVLQIDYDLDLFRFYIDSPRQNLVDFTKDGLLIRGWALSQHKLDKIYVEVDDVIYDFSFNEMRNDVKANLKIISDSLQVYGFRHRVNLPSFSVKLGFKLGDTIIKCWGFNVRKSKVLEGLYGNLFLTNDSNLSIDQYVGNVTLSTNTISDWYNYFSILDSLQVEYKLFLLVPSKEELFKEFYPFERAKQNACDLFLEKFSLKNGLLYPFQELYKYRDFSYLKADTHWSDYGAYICARVILEQLGLSDYSNLLSDGFNVSEFAGDLGNKLPTSKTAIGLKSYKSIAPAFDNLIHNHGRIWIFESTAPIKETLMIFGDSFSASKNANYLANQLSRIFTRVIFIHSAGAIDKSILAYEKPKYLIAQINQRFIIKSPKVVDIWQVVNKKFRTLDLKSREDLKYSIYKLYPKSDTNIVNKYYTEKMLEIIKNALPNDEY